MSRRVAAILLTAVLIAGAAAAFTGRAQQKMRDFEVYWTAGARAAHAEPLYRESDGHYRFKYLPAFAVVLSPLARLPLDTAKATWFALSVASLVGFVGLSVRVVPRPVPGTGWLVVLTVVAMAKFFGHELVLGQANVLFGLVCIAGLWWLSCGYVTLAGVAFGAAAIIKPYAIAFVPYLLLTRSWRAALAASVAVAAIVILPAAVYGIDGNLLLLADWWSTASATSVPLLTNADSSSVFAMYAKWLGWGTTAAALSLLTVAALASAFVVVVAKRATVVAPEVLEVGLLLTFIPLCTPQGWDYVLLLSTPVVALIIARIPSMPRADRWVAASALSLVAFSLYDVMGRAAYRGFMSLSIITVCYLALTGIAVRLRLRGAA